MNSRHATTLALLASCISIGLAEGRYQINPLIVGGTAVVAEVPWMAALKNGEELRCTGTLVAPQWVLTAAHCVGNFDNMVIGTLTWDQPPNDAEAFLVEKMIAHPDYQDPTKGYDLALAKLTGVSTKRPVTLDEEFNGPEEQDGYELQVMGWGITSWGSKVASPVLMETTLQVVNHTYCLDKFREGVSQDLNITDIQLCAMWPGGGRDTCSGDSGGPLVDYDIFNPLQVAVVSYGVQCALPGWPGVYTRISKFYNWIWSVIDAEPKPVFNGTRVNGQWSEWAPWSDCIVACGSGIRTTNRACDNPAPANGGSYCLGPSTRNSFCQGPPCFVDGGWSAWTVWSGCSTKECGQNGTRSQTRTCSAPPPSGGGKACEGESVTREDCSGPCGALVTATWGEWSPWTPCSTSCGPGLKMRMRDCPPDAKCDGNMVDTTSCTLGPCEGATDQQGGGFYQDSSSAAAAVSTSSKQEATTTANAAVASSTSTSASSSVESSSTLSISSALSTSTILPVQTSAPPTSSAASAIASSSAAPSDKATKIAMSKDLVEAKFDVMDNQPLNEDLFRDADYDTDDEEVELEADAIPDSTTLTAPTETPDDAETETETPVGAADSKPVVYAKLPHLPIIKPNRNMVAQSCKIWGCSCQGFALHFGPAIHAHIYPYARRWYIQNKCFKELADSYMEAGASYNCVMWKCSCQGYLRWSGEKTLFTEAWYKRECLLRKY